MKRRFSKLTRFALLSGLLLTPGCGKKDPYRDDFGNPRTLANYDAEGGSPTVADGALLLKNASLLIKDEVLRHKLKDVTVECDIKSLLDNNSGVQGIYVRRQVDGRSYFFDWNDNLHPTGGVVEWQITKYGVGEDKSYTYLGRSKTPVYRVGQWVHVKVVAQGDRLELWVDQRDGKGLQLVLAARDSEYGVGAVGFRTAWIRDNNVTFFDNLRVY
jgi:hypothetical protein